MYSVNHHSTARFDSLGDWLRKQPTREAGQTAEHHRERYGTQMKAESSVTCELRLRLLVAGDAALPVPAALRYDLADPYAIHATFHAAGDTVEWVFARDLLAAGLRDDAGLGDVRVWPSSEAGVQVVYISLSSPEGEALLEAPAPELSTFLDRTYATVPAGSESVHLDIDAALTQLIAES